MSFHAPGTIGWCRWTLRAPALGVPMLTLSGRGSARDVLAYIGCWIRTDERCRRVGA